MRTDRTVAELTDQAWERALRRDPVTALRRGQEVDALPPGGPAAMTADVAAAAAMLELLPPDGDVATGFLRSHLVQETQEAHRFWYRLPVTPYNAAVLGAYRTDVLAAAPLDSAADADRYLSLLNDYAAFVEQIADTMAGQRRRGIRLPAWAVPEAARTVRGHADAAAELVVAPRRLHALEPGPTGRLADGSAHVVEGRLGAAFGQLLADLASDAEAGGDAVGMGQYPGGAECYAGLVQLHTGLDLTPERVHAIGLSEVDRITARIRDELGVTDEAEHRRRLAADPRAYATSPADLERLYSGHVDRLGPHLSRYFDKLPAAPFRLRQLDATLDGLTYGFYEPPGLDGCGYYHYNAANLPDRPLLQAASAIYHEGMPGHHLQIGRHLEDESLHPIQRELTDLRTFAINGYVEGWAEYAAGLCDEMGLYDDPLDAYGRLCMERFQAARLVVDTGLHVLGWSRDRAADYLRVNGSLAESEIASEVYRYAVDDPGQALAYHIGNWYLRGLRDSYGGDPRAFHEAVLAHGPLPLHLLDAVVAGG